MSVCRFNLTETCFIETAARIMFCFMVCFVFILYFVCSFTFSSPSIPAFVCQQPDNKAMLSSRVVGVGGVWVRADPVKQCTVNAKFSPRSLSFSVTIGSHMFNVGSAIHRINHYLTDEYWRSQLLYSVDSNLSGG